MSGARVEGVGLLTPWGAGVRALPDDAARAAGGRRVLGLARPTVGGERFRRATRECLLGVTAVDLALADAGLGRDAVRGGATALVYVTTAAYGAANRAFIDARGAGESGSGGALHFPYTAPSAVPAEVAIEFGLTGAYTILVGGGPTTLEALWHAAGLLGRGACARAVVLAVETFVECADLWARGRWVTGAPLVEAAAAVVLGPGDGTVAVTPSDVASSLETAARRRAGETMAAGPLVALALARAGGTTGPALTARWRGRGAALRGWSA